MDENFLKVFLLLSLASLLGVWIFTNFFETREFVCFTLLMESKGELNFKVEVFNATGVKSELLGLHPVFEVNPLTGERSRLAGVKECEVN